MYDKDGFMNAKYTRYRDGSVRLTVSNWNVFKPAGHESPPKQEYNILQSYLSDFIERRSKEQIARTNMLHNQSRAKRKVFDIAMMNDFKYFITLTLNEKMIDRYDEKIVMKKTQDWLKNMTRRTNLKYLLIPEYHKDGAIHMHGLFSGDFKTEESGKLTTSGKTIYNLPQWKLGYSTCIECYGDTGAVSYYITKYVTKGLDKIFGNYYYAGGGIEREPETTVFEFPYHNLNVFENEVMTGLKFKYLDCDENTFGEYMEKLYCEDKLEVF